MRLEEEFEEINSKCEWGTLFQAIRNASNNFNFTCKVALRQENKNLNRYRDVNPYDHTRIKLNRAEKDYINASLVTVPEANRAYILTQGPLTSTIGHFWLMVWEQNSKAILMLNRVIEKNAIKCSQYWPTGKHNKGDDELDLTDVRLKVKFLSEQSYSHFVIRQLLLTDLDSQQSRVILHFHYTTWPDFGVPESPEAFLEYLYAVRHSGSLDSNVGPAIVHCSAGIGRSGTFCLVDSCLLLIKKNDDPDSINVREILLSMRTCRMGLIQTPDQLRFSYLAIIGGAKLILNNAEPLDNLLFNNKNMILNFNNSNESSLCHSPSSEYSSQVTSPEHENSINNSLPNDEAEDSTPPPPLPPRAKPSLPDKTVSQESSSSKSPDDFRARSTPGDREAEVRKRKRQERIEKTAQLVKNIRQKQIASETWTRRRSLIKKISLGVVLVLGTGFLVYRYYVKP